MDQGKGHASPACVIKFKSQIMNDEEELHACKKSSL